MFDNKIIEVNLLNIPIKIDLRKKSSRMRVGRMCIIIGVLMFVFPVTPWGKTFPELFSVILTSVGILLAIAGVGIRNINGRSKR